MEVYRIFLFVKIDSRSKNLYFYYIIYICKYINNIIKSLSKERFY